MKLILILISFLTYISEILSNDACKTKQCLTECGHVGYFHDVNKCQTCHCNIRKDCPPVRCQLDCLFGRKKDKKGCEYCHCQDPCEDGEKQIICQIGSYCYATHDCEEELHCKIDTRCIKYGENSKQDSSTTKITHLDPSPGPFIPETGNPGPKSSEDYPYAPPPAPGPPTRPNFTPSDCDCSARGCKCKTHKTRLRNTFSESVTEQRETVYKSTDKDEHSTHVDTHIFGRTSSVNSIHIPTVVYAILASILGASILGIVVITVILYKRRYPKYIDSQEEELTKENESVSSTGDDNKNLNLATKV